MKKKELQARIKELETCVDRLSSLMFADSKYAGRLKKEAQASERELAAAMKRIKELESDHLADMGYHKPDDTMKVLIHFDELTKLRNRIKELEKRAKRLHALNSQHFRERNVAEARVLELEAKVRPESP